MDRHRLVSAVQVYIVLTRYCVKSGVFGTICNLLRKRWICECNLEINLCQQPIMIYLLQCYVPFCVIAGHG